MAIFTACLVYGTGCVVMTFLGFAAAFKESKKLLLLNAASLSFGLILGIVMISLLGGIDYNKIINDQNCPDVLRFIDADVFSSLANCSKYEGYATYHDAGGCGSWR